MQILLPSKHIMLFILNSINNGGTVYRPLSFLSFINAILIHLLNNYRAKYGNFLHIFSFKGQMTGRYPTVR